MVTGKNWIQGAGDLHSKLAEQITQALGDGDRGDARLDALYELISQSYEQTDAERRMTQSSLALQSDEIKRLDALLKTDAASDEASPKAPADAVKLPAAPKARDAETGFARAVDDAASSATGLMPAQANVQIARQVIDAIDYFNGGYAVYDRRDRLIYGNAGFLKSFFPGHEDKPEPGMTFEQVLSLHYDLYRDTIKTGFTKSEWIADRVNRRHAQKHNRFVQPTNDGRWVLTGEHTMVNCVVALFTDVTDFHLREEEARRMELLMRAFENVDQGFSIYDAQRRLIYCNSRYREVSFAGIEEKIQLGMTMSEVLGLHYDHILAEEERTMSRDAWISETAETLLLGKRNIERKLADGRWMLLEPHPTPDGGLITIHSDITTFKEREAEARKYTERSLLQNEALVKLANSPALASGDLDTAIKEITAAAGRVCDVERVGVWAFQEDRRKLKCLDLFKLTEEAHSGGTLLDVDAYPRYFKSLKESSVIDADDAVNDERLEELAEGYLKPYNIGAMMDVAVWGGGAVEGVVCFEHVGDTREWTPLDLSFARSIADFVSLAFKSHERQQALEGLKAAKQHAESASRSKSQFLANMSHELRTPLNAIIGFAEILSMDETRRRDDATRRQFAVDILESGRHLLDLINDILDLSKIEAGKFDLRDDEVDIRLVTEESIRLIQQRAEEAGLTISFTVEEGLPKLSGDRRSLKQSLINLLTNAVKFTPQGGVIMVRVFRDTNGDLRFTVTDSGIGIEPKNLAAVLEPFTQVDGSHSRRHEGTGLGLPLVKSFIELHDGKLEIDSVFGSGTTVTAILPHARLLAETTLSEMPGGDTAGAVSA